MVKQMIFSSNLIFAANSSGVFLTITLINGGSVNWEKDICICRFMEHSIADYILWTKNFKRKKNIESKTAEMRNKANQFLISNVYVCGFYDFEYTRRNSIRHTCTRKPHDLFIEEFFQWYWAIIEFFMPFHSRYSQSNFVCGPIYR